MKRYLSITVASLCLSGCVATVPVQPPRAVVYQAPPPVVAAPSPVLVYPAQPLVGESIIIEGVPYYRNYLHGHPYYHHRRP